MKCRREHIKTEKDLHEVGLIKVHLEIGMLAFLSHKRKKENIFP